jgi:N-acetyltransferase
MLAHAFEVWEVESVCLHTDARNERSRRAMERIGAQFEGILRAHRLGTDCLPRDSARFSITAPEWPGVKRRLDVMLAAREEVNHFHPSISRPLYVGGRGEAGRAGG